MKLGFTGAGNMAKAIIGGVLNSGIATKDDIIASAATNKTIDRIAGRYGIKTTLDNKEVAKADIVFLTVKPVYYQQIINEIKDVPVADSQIIVTVAAGVSVQWIEDAFGGGKKVIRTMPNTPALVGEGMTAITPGSNVTDKELEKVVLIFQSFGKTEIVKESMMDAVVAVSGSSPAYVFMFIEAMADAAVAEGMPREQAYRFAAQAVLGSAKMVLETGLHPGMLKDMVCSPGGTTIEAVRALEKTGFRGSVMECMKECAGKSRKMV